MVGVDLVHCERQASVLASQRGGDIVQVGAAWRDAHRSGYFSPLPMIKEVIALF